MNEAREPMVTKAYVLRCEQVDIIEAVARQHGDSSASAALRNIIDEWQIFKGVQLPLPGNGRE